MFGTGPLRVCRSYLLCQGGGQGRPSVGACPAALEPLVSTGKGDGVSAMFVFHEILRQELLSQIVSLQGLCIAQMMRTPTARYVFGIKLFSDLHLACDSFRRPRGVVIYQHSQIQKAES